MDNNNFFRKKSIIFFIKDFFQISHHAYEYKNIFYYSCNLLLSISSESAQK